MKARKTFEPTTTTGVARYITDVSYLDGLGCAVQEIEVGATSGGGDIILAHGYGKFGKEDKVYLPYTKQGNGGSFVGDALNASLWEEMYGSAEAAYANVV